VHDVVGVDALDGGEVLRCSRSDEHGTIIVK
jgi:hypothetical protein